MALPLWKNILPGPVLTIFPAPLMTPVREMGPVPSTVNVLEPRSKPALAVKAFAELLVHVWSPPRTSGLMMLVIPAVDVVLTPRAKGPDDLTLVIAG